MIERTRWRISAPAAELYADACGVTFPEEVHILTARVP